MLVAMTAGMPPMHMMMRPLLMMVPPMPEAVRPAMPALALVAMTAVAVSYRNLQKNSLQSAAA